MERLSRHVSDRLSEGQTLDLVGISAEVDEAITAALDRVATRLGRDGLMVRWGRHSESVELLDWRGDARSCLRVRYRVWATRGEMDDGPERVAVDGADSA